MSSSRPARAGIALGALAVVAIPAACAASVLWGRVTLLHAVEVAVPVAFVAGLASYAAYRRARARLERSVRRHGGGLVRAAGLVGFAGLYLAVTGALALGFYGLLHLRS